MNALEGARRDAAVLAVTQARVRLDAATRSLRASRWIVGARAGLVVLDVVAPIVVALEHLIPPPDL